MGTDRRPTCDLIMKGGITSGVAYPAAVQELSQRYDFVNIGGASAGAIAAAVTAAAQYAGQAAGFDRLRDLRAEMRRPGLLPQLFQATKETRPLLELLLATQRSGAAWLRYPLLALRVIRRMALPTGLWTAAGFAVLATMLGGAGARWSSLRWPAITAMVAVLLVIWLAALVGCIVFRLLRTANTYLPTSNFGMCLGKSEDGSGQPALTEWLHARIQWVAGLDEARPLTFADLAERGMQLRVMTTDLTWARPIRFPQTESVYHYSPEDFAALFPPEILDHMAGHSGPPSTVLTPYGPRTLRPLPCAQLPVLVATRMSLALPILLAAVPLWIINESGQPERHWMSDGGISSNFPMHFFDAWVPVRPTFGLNLMSSEAKTTDDPIEDDVHVYTNTPPPHRAFPITSLTSLLGQALATMQNWHDILQAELDGFHDRIAYIDLSRNEGGMNISMPDSVIERVDAKGRLAGQLLRDKFDWRRHQLLRYRTFMGLLQGGLTPDTASSTSDSSTVRDAWRAGLEALLASDFDAGDSGDPPPSWYRAAAEATRNLLQTANDWLGPDADDPSVRLTFRPDPPPNPPARMRVTPDV